MSDNLLDPRHTLIHWNEASQKWQDIANNIFCSQRHGDKWRVGSRYNFEDGRSYIEFDTEREAMEFFINYVFAKRMKLIDEAFEKVKERQ